MFQELIEILRGLKIAIINTIYCLFIKTWIILSDICNFHKETSKQKNPSSLKNKCICVKLIYISQSKLAQGSSAFFFFAGIHLPDTVILTSVK